MNALVLIVDRVPKRLVGSRRLVEGEGAETLTASDPCDAMRLFVRRKPDLTFVHVDASDELGVELCRDMKILSAGRQRRLIVVGPRALRAVALSAGCDEFVDIKSERRAILRAIRLLLASPQRPIATAELHL